MPGGVREERKRETRERIASIAMDLFVRRGFEAVSVDTVAKAAGVTEKTVFNHFATKEDLVYSADGVFERALVAAIRERLPGESVLPAVAAFLLALYSGYLLDRARQRRHADLARLVAASPALQARERLILARYAAVLRAAIAEEQGADDHDLRPQVCANALISTHSAVIGAFRWAVLAGQAPDEFAFRITASAEEAFSILCRGLGDYARKGA